MKAIIIIGIIALSTGIVMGQGANDISFNSRVLIGKDIKALHYVVKTKCTPGDLANDSELPLDERKCRDGAKDTTMTISPVRAKANIKIDGKDKAKLRVNYWIFDYDLKRDTFEERFINRTSMEKGDTTRVETAICNPPLGRKYTVEESMKITRDRKNYSVCQRFWANEKIRSTDFYIPLKNRSNEEFLFNSLNMTILTIPIKYHLPFSKDGVEIYSRAQSSINGNIYWNVRRGKAKYFYERNSDKKIYLKNQISAGIITGISLTEISGKNSLLRINEGDTLQGSRFAPTFSLGGGLTYGYRQFNFGIFGGWDFAIGTDHSYWDYQGRPWIGFGISVSSLLSIL